MKPITLAVLASAFAVSAAVTAAAQTPEQFYKGKQIELAIGYPPAGSNDVYARLLARHIGKHIPGNPDRGAAEPARAPARSSRSAMSTTSRRRTAP